MLKDTTKNEEIILRENLFDWFLFVKYVNLLLKLFTPSRDFPRVFHSIPSIRDVMHQRCSILNARRVGWMVVWGHHTFLRYLNLSGRINFMAFYSLGNIPSGITCWWWLCHALSMRHIRLREQCQLVNERKYIYLVN